MRKILGEFCCALKQINFSDHVKHELQYMSFELEMKKASSNAIIRVENQKYKLKVKIYEYKSNTPWKVSKYGVFLVGIFLYLDQKKFRISTLFMQCNIAS